MTKKSTIADIYKRLSDGSCEILDAAAGLFRERGFSATTVRQIAEAAGILPGSLHYRYASKQELLEALMEQAVERTTVAVRNATDGVRDPSERLRLAMRAYLELLLSGDDSLYVLLYDWRSLGGTAREKVQLLHDRLHALFDGLFYEAAGAGHIRADVDLKMMRHMWMGALNWTVQWYQPGSGRDPDAIADLFWNLLTTGAFDSENSFTGIGAAVAGIETKGQTRS